MEKKIYNRICSLVGKNKINEAVSLFKTQARKKAYDDNVIEELKLLEARLVSNNRSENLGLLSQADLLLEKARITSAFLSLVTELFSPYGVCTDVDTPYGENKS